MNNFEISEKKIIKIFTTSEKGNNEAELIIDIMDTRDIIFRTYDQTLDSYIDLVLTPKELLEVGKEFVKQANKLVQNNKGD